MNPIKIRYTKEEVEILKEKAKKENKTLEQYQKDISLNSSVIIEIEEPKNTNLFKNKKELI